MGAVRGTQTRRRSPVRTWKLYSVSVSGFGREIIHALSKQAAVREARQCEAFRAMTMTQFSQIATVYRITEPLADDGYEYIRKQFGIEVRIHRRCWVKDTRSPHYGKIGNVLYAGRSTSRVRVAFEGQDKPLNFHPLEIGMDIPASIPQAA
jgi:hypothetical protein